MEEFSNVFILSSGVFFLFYYEHCIFICVYGFCWGSHLFFFYFFYAYLPSLCTLLIESVFICLSAFVSYVCVEYSIFCTILWYCLLSFFQHLENLILYVTRALNMIHFELLVPSKLLYLLITFSAYISLQVELFWSLLFCSLGVALVFMEIWVLFWLTWKLP